MEIHSLTELSDALASGMVLAIDNGTVTAKVDVTTIEDHTANTRTYSGLTTTAKTLTGAANELNTNKYDLLNSEELTTSDSLDALITPGTYTATGAVASAITGSPITVAFRMIVEKAGGATGTRYRQILWRGDAGAESYIRVTTDGGSTWTKWEKSVPIRHLYIQNASTNKKIQVKQSAKTRGSLLIHGVDNSGNPRLLSLVWGNSMTSVTATDVIGSGGFGTPTIDATTFTVEVTVPNYFSGIAIPSANNAAMTIDLVSVS